MLDVSWEGLIVVFGSYKLVFLDLGGRGGGLVEIWWVLKAKIFVQFEISESQQRNIEFHESADDFVVDIER